jgi:hypothetical protein
MDQMAKSIQMMGAYLQKASEEHAKIISMMQPVEEKKHKGLSRKEAASLIARRKITHTKKL